MIIGLAGNPQSGKDTAAEALVCRGYERRSFAHKLKSICSDLFDIPMETFEDGTRKATIDERYGLTPREILIKVGTDCCRAIRSDVWVSAVLKNTGKNIVVSDCRFQNEVDAIIEAGGVIIRIIRPGFTGEGDVQFIDWDKTPHVRLDNNHTLLVLKLKTQSLEREMYKSIQEVKGIA